MLCSVSSPLLSSPKGASDLCAVSGSQVVEAGHSQDGGQAAVQGGPEEVHPEAQVAGEREEMLLIFTYSMYLHFLNLFFDLPMELFANYKCQCA